MSGFQILQFFLQCRVALAISTAFKKKKNQISDFYSTESGFVGSTHVHHIVALCVAPFVCIFWQKYFMYKYIVLYLSLIQFIKHI